MNVLNTITSRFFKPKHAEPVHEYHLALELTPIIVKASLWTLWNGEVQVLGVGKSIYGFDDWEGALESADTAIAQAVESGNISISTVSKVMFGLPDSWVVSDKIQEPYFAHLKRVAKELDLTPLAFVSLSESLSYYYKQREGSPLSAVLIGIFDSSVIVTVLRAGVNSASKSFTRSNDSLAVDIEQVLSHFAHVEVFPSRIILYGDTDLHSFSEELLAHSWVDNGLFIHFPKVECSDVDADVLSVSLAGGLDLARRTGIDTGSVTVRKVYDSSAAKLSVSTPIIDEMAEAVHIPAHSDPAETLGFIKGKDYAKETGSHVPVSYPLVSSVKPVSVPVQHLPIQEPIVTRTASSSAAQPETIQSPYKESKPRFSFKPGLPHISFPFHFGRGVTPIIGALIIVFLILGAGGVWVYWNVPKAKVRLMVEPRVLEKEISVLVNTSLTDNSNDSLEIPGKEATVTVKEAMRAVAQGTKTVGDKAKGEVTVFNKTPSVKTFPSGSVLILTGSSSLKFILDDDVKVASASESVGKLDYGSGNARVTALDIGTDSNISAGNTFSFKDFGTISYSARNDSAFSGGSSRKVTVVTKSDQDRLEATLSAELKEKAKQEIQTQISGSERFLDGSITTTVSSRKFDKNIDEEAKEVGLTMEVVAKGVTFTEENLKKIVVFSSRDSVPSDFLLREEDITYATEFGKVMEDGKTLMKVRYKVNLVPDLKTDQIARDLTGKSHAFADRYLNQKNLLADFSIEYDPPLPGFLKTLPHNPKNIKVEVVPR